MQEPLMRLALHSEPYAPTGNIGDSGFRKLLGTPSMDILQTVIREAVQNSCDADKSGKGPRILIRLRTLTDSQINVLRSNYLVELPECPGSREPFEGFLSSDHPVVMEICDFNTSGLGGPTRADRIPPNNATTDFIDFLRNVGTTRDTNLGGGTYGFGKVSLYLAGRCSSIIVDTLADAKGGGERRLMGCHLGPAFSKNNPDGSSIRYTGRHWWGVKPSEGDFVEPATGNAAAELASGLGFPIRQPTDTGTSIMILGPHLNDEPLEDGARRLIEGLLWNFWPRMMETTRPEKKVHFSVFAEDKEINVPNPEEYPPLDLFCRAMNHIRASTDEVQTVRSQRPKKDLGKLVISKGVRAPRAPLVLEDSIIPKRTHHIAVMRPVELVVRYFDDGDPLPDERTEWAGVFVTSAEPAVEKAFADSEPPAHDDWMPSMLPRGAEKTWVSVGVREIKKAAKEVASPGSTVVGGARTTISLASVSGKLGSLLGAGEGEGAGPRRGRSGGGGTARKRRISNPEFLSLELREGKRIAVFEAELSGAGSATIVEAVPVFAVEGGSMPADGADALRDLSILEMSLVGTDRASSASSLKVGSDSGTVRVLVNMPDDCSVMLKLQLAGDPA